MKGIRDSENNESKRISEIIAPKEVEIGEVMGALNKMKGGKASGLLGMKLLKFDSNSIMKGSYVYSVSLWRTLLYHKIISVC